MSKMQRVSSPILAQEPTADEAGKEGTCCSPRHASLSYRCGYIAQSHLDEKSGLGTWERAGAGLVAQAQVTRCGGGSQVNMLRRDEGESTLEVWHLSRHL